MKNGVKIHKLRGYNGVRTVFICSKDFLNVSILIPYEFELPFWPLNPIPSKTITYDE